MIQEDDPGWDCTQHGNRICGPDQSAPTTVSDCAFSSPDAASPECTVIVHPSTIPAVTTTTTATVEASSNELPVTGADVAGLAGLAVFWIVLGAGLLFARRCGYKDTPR